jgi:acyl-CoA reductase-like NAD-dependent aldehyde dehydrogenase
MKNLLTNITRYIDNAKTDPNAEIIAGGNYDKTKGYFIEPTVIEAKVSKVCFSMRRNFWARAYSVCV